jgi:hypothetical protein
MASRWYSGVRIYRSARRSRSHVAAITRKVDLYLSVKSRGAPFTGKICGIYRLGRNKLVGITDPEYLESAMRLPDKLVIEDV